MSNFDEILCHCRMNPDGHEPGSVLDCEAPKLTRTRVGFPKILTIGEYARINLTMVKPRGTCPVCREQARVQRVEVHRDSEGERRAGRFVPPVTNPAKPRGTALEIRPGMVPHKIKGVECAGSGQVPVETRFTPGRELAGYLEILREEEKSA